MLLFKLRLREKPVQARALTHPAFDQAAFGFCGMADVRKRDVFARFGCDELAIGPHQIGRQEPVQIADDNQCHVVRGVPTAADFFDLLEGQRFDVGSFGAFET